MATFQDSLKNAFYGLGANVLSATSSICLLDANGNPIGSDTIERVSSYIYTKEDMVDMGLPSGTLWCKKNVGATVETASGWYFSWGNLDAHAKGAGYDFSDANYNASSAASISGNLTLAQDAARANKGAGWRMPSKEEFAELFDATNTEYVTASGNVITGTDKRTTYNGVTGLLIRSKANGNTLFFPAAGLYHGSTLDSEGSSGLYWSSSFYSAANAHSLNFGSSGVHPQSSSSRRYGFSVRPVQ